MLSQKEIYEYAVLIQQIYFLETNNGILPENWRAVFHWAPEGGWENLYGLFVNKERKELVLAIRGTNKLPNVLTDLSLIVQALTGEHPIPNGQRETQLTATGIHYHFNNSSVDLNTDDIQNIKSIGESINQIQTDFGRSITDWVIALMFIAATTVGFYASNQIVPLDAVTELVKGRILLGESMETLQSANDQVTGRTKTVLAQKSSSIKNLKIAISNTINETFPDFTFKVVGYSSGAVMAEICAAELDMECITFESPGSLSIMKSVTSYNEIIQTPDTPIKITNFLSAPNLINTLNGHPGISYRLFLPHTNGEFSFWHHASCLWGSGSRVASYLSFGGFTVGKLLAEKAAKEAALKLSERALVGAAVGKWMGGVAGLWRDPEWIQRQHQIDSIVFHLDVKKTNHLTKIAKILSWPQTLTFDTFAQCAVDSLRSCVLPFQKDLPGIRNQFDEEGMREAQISRIDGYSVEEILE